MLSRVLAITLAGAALTACITTAPKPPATHPAVTLSSPAPQAAAPFPPALPESPPATPPIALPSVSAAFAGLEGWADDDHVAAFAAVLAGCPIAKDAAMASVCRRAAALDPVDESSARDFLERNFQPEPMAESGLLTAYFTPIYEARLHREGDFTAPVRPRPADLPHRVANTPRPYPDRAEIEKRPASDALAWMRPEDLFFLQIQGSGVLIVPEGMPLRAVFDGSNGAPFLGLAAPMRKAGLLDDADTSAERIRSWLSANRGPRAEAVMRLDRRYVFFRLQPDDGSEPAGTAGRRLIPGRALAVDPSRHAMGEVLWVDATSPALSGAFPNYRRLATALDTGGAIKGEGRADLYLGRGPDAGVEAGRVRHVLRLYRLTPLIQPLS
jgi:membrane-bound lytic murein transglycosylase A